jgi:hypothetical protein
LTKRGMEPASKKTLEGTAAARTTSKCGQQDGQPRTSTSVERLGGEAHGQDNQPAARCMIELGSSSP